MLKQVSRSIKITLNYTNFNIQPTQFPMVPAFAITIEKCQGITLDAMIVAPLRTVARSKPQPNSLYVVLSRITDVTFTGTINATGFKLFKEGTSGIYKTLSFMQEINFFMK